MISDYRFFIMQEDRDPRRTLNTLAARHGVQILVLEKELRTRDNIQAAPLTSPTEYYLNFYAPQLARCLNRYPSGFFKGIGLKSIVLCGLLESQSAPALGLASYREKAIYFGVDLEHSTDSVIHHEIFHFLDYRQGTFSRDREWDRLHRASLQTMTPTWREHSLATGDFRPNHGFVSAYAAANMAEDKAETFAYLLTDWRRVMRLSENDPLLRQKIALLSERLSRRPTSFGEEFWRKAVEFDTSY